MEEDEGLQKKWASWEGEDGMGKLEPGQLTKKPYALKRGNTGARRTQGTPLVSTLSFVMALP